jgi:hypothetical protein
MDILLNEALRASVCSTEETKVMCPTCVGPTHRRAILAGIPLPEIALFVPITKFLIAGGRIKPPT